MRVSIDLPWQQFNIFEATRDHANNLRILEGIAIKSERLGPTHMVFIFNLKRHITSDHAAILPRGNGEEVRIHN